MLTRLIYASESTQPLTPSAVQTLVNHARQANARLQVTGVLAFDHRAFLQCLEGDRETVSGVFCRIAADTRHHRVVLLDLQSVDERLFSSWGMGFAAADAVGRDAFLRFGSGASFDPHAMSAGAAIGLLQALASRID